MSNIINLHPTVQLTNQEFLDAWFGVRWDRAHVTAFPGDPAAGQWAGWRAGKYPAVLERPDLNQYFTVSLFMDDPVDGRARRVEALFTALYGIMVDDVGTKLKADTVRTMMGEPSYRIETSPGNEQWGYLLDMPHLDKGQAKALIRGLIAKGLAADHKDPGMRGVTRYGRMPVGNNGKAAYGGRFAVRVLEWRPERRFTVAELATGAGVTLPPEGTDLDAHDNAPLARGAREDDGVLGVLRELGAVRGLVGSRWGYEVTCPCVDDHTGGLDNGCAYRPGGWGKQGRFVCHHGSCQERDWRGFMDGLDERLVGAKLPRMRDREFDLVDTSLFPKGPRETFMGEHVLMLPANAFYSLRTGELVSRQTANLMWAKALAPHLDRGPKAKAAPVDVWWAAQRDRRTVDRLTYWPGRERVFAEAGVDMANTWLPAELPRRPEPVGNAEIAVWLELVKHVVHGEGPRAVVRFLDWCAGVVAVPSLKPAWMVCVQGKQGIGKDLMIQPVQAGVGRDNVASIKGDDLGGGFTAYAGKRLVVVSELRQTTRGATSGHDQYNRVKWLVDSTAKTLPVNPKYGREYTAINTAAVFTSTNEQAALALEADDRRAFVVMSDAEPWAAARYARVGDWLERDGTALVVQWLTERWTRMGANRRASLAGRAPRTRGKAQMLTAGLGPVGNWIAERLAQDTADALAEWPDLMTVDEVMARVQIAVDHKRLGLPAGTRVPAARALGRLLSELGLRQAAGGEPVRLPSGERTRIWAMRDVDRLAKMGGAECAKARASYVTGAGADFGGDVVT